MNNSKLKTIEDKLNYFQEKKLENEKEYAQIKEKVSSAKTRAEISLKIKPILEELQTMEHKRLVGVFENLLTALLKDVFEESEKNNPVNRKIELELYSERGMPGVSVLIKKDDNPPEEISKAGAINNILSVGLRVIALIRSQKRKFLILDEPDGWIKPTLIGKFSQVIENVARELGIQILMISHHEEKNFDHIEHKLHLFKNKDGVIESAWALNTKLPVWGESEDNEEYIKQINIKNFQSHTNTVIPLSKHLTLLFGANDIGKSGIVDSLRSVFYGESRDHYITHGKDNFNIEIEFTKNRKLSFTRNRKNKNKVIYELFENDVSIKKTIGASEIPEWVDDFGLNLIEDIDVILRGQNEPVFLLNLSPAQKAKTIAIGSEAGYVQKMMTLELEEKRESLQYIKFGESKLEELYRFKETYCSLNENMEKFLKLKKLHERYNLNNENLTRNQIILEKTKKIKKVIEWLNLSKNIKNIKIFTPKYTEQNVKLLKNYLNIKKIKTIYNMSLKVSNIEKFHEKSRAENIVLLNKYLKLKNFIEILSLCVPKIKTDLIVDGKFKHLNVKNNNDEFLKKIKATDILLKQTKKERNELEKQEIKINTEINEIKKETKSCPTCGKFW